MLKLKQVPLMTSSIFRHFDRVNTNQNQLNPCFRSHRLSLVGRDRWSFQRETARMNFLYRNGLGTTIEFDL